VAWFLLVCRANGQFGLLRRRRRSGPAVRIGSTGRRCRMHFVELVGRARAAVAGLRELDWNDGGWTGCWVGVRARGWGGVRVGD